uniref:H(+)-exporting diphosphatase n=1 Tax=Tanacetum cinerariifolium TaxID=118510 RepID=A0A6L2MTK9_TANCI|nr:pyrophosphatase [Tanacetum cinerariifolium]
MIGCKVMRTLTSVEIEIMLNLGLPCCLSSSSVRCLESVTRIFVAALRMLSTIPIGMAIDAYGPISNNVGGIAEMAVMSHHIRERTDALDAARNTTATTGKVGFFSLDIPLEIALYGILYWQRLELCKSR